MGIVEIIGLIADITMIFWTLLIVVSIFVMGVKLFIEYAANSGNEPEEEKDPYKQSLDRIEKKLGISSENTNTESEDKQQ